PAAAPFPAPSARAKWDAAGAVLRDGPALCPDARPAWSPSAVPDESARDKSAAPGWARSAFVELPAAALRQVAASSAAAWIAWLPGPGAAAPLAALPVVRPACAAGQTDCPATSSAAL